MSKSATVISVDSDLERNTIEESPMSQLDLTPVVFARFRGFSFVALHLPTYLPARCLILFETITSSSLIMVNGFNILISNIFRQQVSAQLCRRKNGQR
jgi:hypothetical protein